MRFRILISTLLFIVFISTGCTAGEASNIRATEWTWISLHNRN